MRRSMEGNGATSEKIRHLTAMNTGLAPQISGRRAHFKT